MEKFLGLSRDSSNEKAEFGSSPFNRNVSYDKVRSSITQEDGFTFSHLVPGVILGECSLNSHIVYITFDSKFNANYIVYVNTYDFTVTTVLHTFRFGYEVTRPIDIIAWYNYNQDIIIMFSDGVFAKSSAPRLMNLMNIGVVLNSSKEFVTQRDADSTLLFSIIKQPTFKVKYGTKTNNDIDIAFFTISYILPDGITRTKFISTPVEGFPIYGFRSEYRRALIFSIANLDPFFTQFIIGIVVFRDNALFGYTTDPISYTAANTNYDYNLTSLEDLNGVSVETILVDTIVYNKIKSLTIGNDVVVLGGVISNNTKSYQKYACNLKLNLYFDDRHENRHQAPLLCPDEVYYFTIALADNNGVFSEEFHIPGPDLIPSDTTLIDTIVYGLTDLGIPTVPSFKLINTGNWVNLTPRHVDFTDPADTLLTWGKWHNTELYPNDDNYNGTIDYNGLPISDGRDMREKRVKFHRVPGLDNLGLLFPMRLGMDIKNADRLPAEFDYHNKLPAFGINVDNFTHAFQTPLLAGEISAYRLSFVKKDNNSKIVGDINFIKPLVTYSDFPNYDSPHGPIQSLRTIDSVWFPTRFPYNFEFQKYYQFGISKVASINLSLYKGSNSYVIAKANYAVFSRKTDPWVLDQSTFEDVNSLNSAYKDLKNDSWTKGTLGEYADPGNPASANLDAATSIIYGDTNRFAVISALDQIAGNSDSDFNLHMTEKIRLACRNTNTALPGWFTTYAAWNPLGFNIPTYPWNPLSPPVQYLNLFNNTSHSYVTAPIPTDYQEQIYLSTTFLSLPDNIHQGLRPNSFVIIGATPVTISRPMFKDFGDVFTNNIYNDITGYMANRYFGLDFFTGITYLQQIFSGMIAVDNNTLIDFKKDMSIGKTYTTRNPERIAEMLTFDLTKQQYNKPSTRQLNSLIANTPFNWNKKYLKLFPYRIAKSLPIQSEDLSTTNVRSFLANAYYDMPSMRGDITYVLGFDKGFYCQQKYSLSIFQLKEKLNNNDDNSAYLAESDLFAFKPVTIVDEDNKGYIGSVHQFGKKLSKLGLITVDAERGKIYIIAGSTPREISKLNMFNYFKRMLVALTTKIIPTLFNPFAVQDNPYNASGILIGVDDKNNRILITINNYVLKTMPTGFEVIDGIVYRGATAYDIKTPTYSTYRGATLSFNLDLNAWISEHDYYPQFYINTNKDSFAGVNAYNNSINTATADKNAGHLYSINQPLNYLGLYFTRTGNERVEAYTDLLFNSRYDLDKWYKSVIWRTTANDNIYGNIDRNITINAIILYTDYQCSGRIELDPLNVDLIRNPEGAWTFNSFRDMSKYTNGMPVDKNGSYHPENVFSDRPFYDKSDFISNFMIVRLIMNNIDNYLIAIHNVNVESRTSDRI